MDGLEVLHDLRQVGELRLALLDRLRNHEAGGVAIQRAHRVALLALQPRQHAQGLLQVLFQLLDRRLRLLLALRGPGIELGGRHHLAVLHRRHGEAHRRAQDRDALRRRLVAHRGERALVPAAALLLDGGAALLVVLALERRGQRDLQVVDQPVQRLVQRRRPAGRQRDRHRPMRRGEVVDIDPVRRLRAFGRGVFQQGAHRTLDVRAVRADGEDVEAAHRHLGAEPDRLVRTRLVGELAQRGKLPRRLEAQRRDVGLPVQPVRRERRGGLACGHQLLSWRARRRAANSTSLCCSQRQPIRHSPPALPPAQSVPCRGPRPGLYAPPWPECSSAW